MLIDLIWIIFGVIIIVLALRFALLLFGANPAAPFTQLVYGLSGPLMAPFEAVFGATAVERSVFDWSTLLAMFIYSLIGWLLSSLVLAIVPPADYQQVSTDEASVVSEDTVEHHDTTYDRDVHVERDAHDHDHPAGTHPAHGA